MQPSYVINEQHRDNNHEKCQWTISRDEERSVFQVASQRGWLLAEEGWGLHFPTGPVEHLGVSQDRRRKLVIAKFKANIAPVFWHGYPADPWTHQHDIPTEPILANWLVASSLPAAKLRKLMRKQKCHL